MEKKYFVIGFLSSLLCVVFFNACSSTSSDSPPQQTESYACDSVPVAKGGRTFGMDILNTPTANGNFDSNIADLQSLKGSFQTLHLNWNQIEAAGSGSTSGVFSDPNGALQAMNTYANSTGIKVTLRIHPVDVPGKFVPSDLLNERFNTADMQTRFRNMLSFVFTKISTANVTRVVVGNEVDAYNPGADSNFWYDYPTFLFNLNSWLGTNYSLDLGFAATLNGIITNAILSNSGGQTTQAILAGWISVSDFLGITYYGIDSNFQVKPNSAVAGNFENLVAFTNAIIHIEEVGYPSGAQGLGSEDLQSEFFCEVFKAWDRFPTQILSLAALRMVDIPRSEAETKATEYTLTGNENFIEYLRTLGIKSVDNQAKPAFNIIKSELLKRGF
jgi:hypothetical protein